MKRSLVFGSIIILLTICSLSSCKFPKHIITKKIPNLQGFGVIKMVSDDQNNGLILLLDANTPRYQGFLFYETTNFHVGDSVSFQLRYSDRVSFAYNVQKMTSSITSTELANSFDNLKEYSSINWHNQYYHPKGETGSHKFGHIKPIPNYPSTNQQHYKANYSATPNSTVLHEYWVPNYLDANVLCEEGCFFALHPSNTIQGDSIVAEMAPNHSSLRH